MVSKAEAPSRFESTNRKAEINMTDENSPDGNKAVVPNGELYFESIGKGDPLILVHSGVKNQTACKTRQPTFLAHFLAISCGISQDALEL